MKRKQLFPLLLFLVIACSPVMQLTTSMASPTLAGIASATPAFPKPRVNIFAGMTSNQEACLRQAWGNEVFQAITPYQRPPNRDEEKAIPQCLGDMVPVKTLVPTVVVDKPTQSALSSLPNVFTFTPCSGDNLWRPSEPGPWRMRLMIAYSNDSLNFTHANQVLISQADVPNVITTPDGEVRVYFICFCPEKVRNKLVVAISRDTINWTYRKVNDENTGELPFTVDPTVELLPEGRYRLYFTSVPGKTDQQGGNMRSYSAISDDGFVFTLEADVRFTLTGQDVLDPSVLLIGQTWHYFAGGSPDWNYHATSTDGLNFTCQDNFMLENILMSNSLAVDGGYRYYGFVQDQGAMNIRSLFTPEGVNWIVDPGNRLGLEAANGLEVIGVKDPSVTRRTDGRYLMIYSTFNPEFVSSSP